MRRLRITRLVPALDFGGVESRVALQSAMASGYDLRVCTFWKDGRAAEEVRAAGVPVDVLGVDPAVRNPRATRALAEYLRQARPDVLHASISEANFHAAIAGPLTGVGCRIIEEVGVPERSRLARRVFGALYRGCHRVVAVSHATARLLRDEGASERQLRVIHNCAHPRFFAPPPPRTGDGVELLAVGRLVPVKNHATLLRAFRAVVNVAPQARLRIAGEGPLAPALRAQIDALHLHEHVELLGYRGDVLPLLHRADAFLLPSFNEGCSVSLIEAMGAGLVVLGSTAAGIGEALGELGPAHQIPATDLDGWTRAMLRVVQMPREARAALGAEARAIAARRFSPEAYDANLRTLYRELAEERGL